MAKKDKVIQEGYQPKREIIKRGYQPQNAEDSSNFAPPQNGTAAETGKKETKK